MEVMVRLSQDLARASGRSRLTVTLDEAATIADLLAHLRLEYPTNANPLAAAVPVIAGQHVGNDTRLTEGQEVSLLTPISGGRSSQF